MGSEMMHGNMLGKGCFIREHLGRRMFTDMSMHLII
jgi:hypothetical protein